MLTKHCGCNFVVAQMKSALKLCTKAKFGDLLLTLAKAPSNPQLCSNMANEFMNMNYILYIDLISTLSMSSQCAYYALTTHPLLKFEMSAHFLVKSAFFGQFSSKFAQNLKFEPNLNLASFKTSFIHWTDEIRKEGECWLLLLLLLLWTNKSILSPPAEQSLHMPQNGPKNFRLRVQTPDWG